MDWLVPQPATIPNRYLIDCNTPLANGFDKKALLDWGLAQHEAISLCNARILCAREINSGKIEQCKERIIQE